MALASNGVRRYLAAAVYALGLTFTAIAALGSQQRWASCPPRAQSRSYRPNSMACGKPTAE
jgi:hypothetical protein